MTSTEIGPAEAPDVARRKEAAYLAQLAEESDHAVSVINAQIEGLQETADSRQREADEYRARARKMGA